MDIKNENLGFQRICSLIASETISQPGREKAESLMPLPDIKKILTMQDRITALKKLADNGNELPLEFFADVRPELTRCRIKGTFVSTETLFHIRKQLKQVDLLLQFNKANRENLKSFTPLFALLNSHQPFQKLIDRIIDDNGEIRDNASPNLASIRKEIQQTSHQLNRQTARLMEIAKREKWLRDENPTIREGRLVLPMKSECKRKMSGIIHGQSATGATAYVEPIEMVEINNTLKELAQDEKEEIERILLKVTDDLRPVFPDLDQNLEVLAEIDCFRACARFSRKFNCHPVDISENDRKVVLINARHPLLQMVKSVVPLKFFIKGDIKAVVITGPNAGGKTVAMKTIGLLSEMAMAGLHIPAEEGSQLPFFDQFLVDIGDQQSIENDLSTFSSHVSQLKSFIEKATEKSIVLLDELGTGTEPLEGAALGQATLEELIQLDTFTIVTTHHNSLKAFADKHPQAMNAAMEFNTETLTPTFRIVLGLPGSSYALEISRRLGLNESVIQRAHDLMGNENVKLENLLREIEKLQTDLVNEKEVVSRNKKTLDKLISDYELKVAKIMEKQEKMDKELSEQLERIANESRAKIESAVKEIRETNASREAVLRSKKVVQEISQEARKRKKTARPSVKPVEHDDLVAGAWVKVEGITEVGQIVNVSAQNKRAAVSIGGKTLWVDKSALSPTTQSDSKNRNFTSLTHIEAEQAPSQRLDIRGMRVDEAERALIKYLDQSILSGLNSVEIIHGMGTGALQKVTRDILEHFPGVKRFYFEDFDHGGTGATIVEF